MRPLLPVIPDASHSGQCGDGCPYQKLHWVQTHPDDFPYTDDARCTRFRPNTSLRHEVDADRPTRWSDCVNSQN